MEKTKILKVISKLYHDMNGVIGHRMMRVFLARKNIYLSKTTIHTYINKQLGLKSR
jgi:hypothetical protein